MAIPSIREAAMMDAQSGNFERRILGRTGLEVGRVGISSSYGVSGDVLERAFERGIDYIYWGSRRLASFGEGLKRLKPQRDRFVLVIQSYTRIASLMAWSLERALRELHFDHTDVLLLGMWNKPVPPRILDAARELKRRGLVRFLAISTHHRATVPQVALANDFDIVHFRYNAAHPGAEKDIYPHLPVINRPGMVSFTATSWGQLTGQANIMARIANPSHSIPKGERVPTAMDCYRFVLSRPEVDVCMTGPSNAERMEEAFAAWERGPMTEEELAWMYHVGLAVAGK
jgi:aryl-alcohol dehydrogenase-like predicted oxidoreductase